MQPVSEIHFDTSFDFKSNFTANASTWIDNSTAKEGLTIFVFSSEAKAKPRNISSSFTVFRRKSRLHATPWGHSISAYPEKLVQDRILGLQMHSQPK
jgi:hypothetical protein